MMIVLTVKTLDSQNHTFTVDDDITVEEFKTKIAETVNIPPDTQRLIYCGRVLQDQSKLNDYDVNGKVVHLVQRPPPSQNQPPNQPGQSQRRGIRGMDRGNTMYLGSMAFPSNFMESQGIVPPPPTHSLAGSRLNVAKRMLRRAEAVIALLENPAARPNEQPATEDQQEEEVTPIIEARVIVPSGNNEGIDEAMVLSAVQNSLFDAAASGSMPLAAEVTIESNTSSADDTPTTERSPSSTPEEGLPPATPAAGSSEQSTGGASARSIAENASRTSEMAELLTTLNQLQARFAPFLERYRNFMVEDPTLTTEVVRPTQALLTRVSEVMHLLGHAYHSLSDIIVRARTQPPRPLLCRPILIQHSAVVQAGIPIQLEAQINVSTERPNTTGPEGTTSTSTTTTTTATNTGSTPRTPQRSPPQVQQPTVNIRGFPFMPGAQMRVQSFPIELRTSGRPVMSVNATQRPPNNNNNTTAANAPTTATASAPNAGAGPNPFNISNSSVEFFMEVSPEGALNSPPPELLQSLVQMAGQIMTHVVPTSAPPQEGPAATDGATSATTQAPNIPGQNSQARGNTQTNPTTATHTRSTPRPHVHLAQQAMQGGFDPFLPCNSHHVTHRRRQQIRQQLLAAAAASNAPPEPQEPAAPPPDPQELFATEMRERQRLATQNLHNLFDEIYTSLRSAYRRRREVDRQYGFELRRQRLLRGMSADPREVSEAATTAANAIVTAGEDRRAAAAAAAAADPSAATGGAAREEELRMLGTFLPDVLLSFIANIDNRQRITDLSGVVAREWCQRQETGHILVDFAMVILRNLQCIDLATYQLSTPDALTTALDEISSFCARRVLLGGHTPDDVNHGIDVLLEEFQPFFRIFSSVRVRDNIDLVRSVEAFFRARLPHIIIGTSILSTETVYPHLEDCLTFLKMLTTLVIRASLNGLEGAQEAFRLMIITYLSEVPPSLQNWIISSICPFLGNLGVEASVIERHIVKNESNQQNELMEVEVAQESRSADLGEASSAEASAPEDEEPLPEVVLGSEAWHGQVPEDWVPIIARDVQRQRRQNPQAAFSDGYLSGMPTKRRKIVNSSKPQGSLPQVIAESVRRAVTSTGLGAVAPVEVVSQGAGESADVQNAYRNLLRSTVQTAMRDNEDFTPERFPNASTYFKPQ